MSRIDLKVPFHEKEQVKALGARWDSAKKTWYVPPREDAMKFAKWHHVIAEWEDVVDEKGRLTPKGEVISARQMQHNTTRRIHNEKQRTGSQRQPQQ